MEDFSGSQPFRSHVALLIMEKSGCAPELRGQKIYGHNSYYIFEKKKFKYKISHISTKLYIFEKVLK